MLSGLFQGKKLFWIIGVVALIIGGGVFYLVWFGFSAKYEVDTSGSQAAGTNCNRDLLDISNFSAGGVTVTNNGPTCDFFIATYEVYPYTNDTEYINNQKLFASDGGGIAGGATYTFNVSTPGCYHQTDLVSTIREPPSYHSSEFYGVRSGGNVFCGASEPTPTPTSTPTPTPTPTPTAIITPTHTATPTFTPTPTPALLCAPASQTIYQNAIARLSVAGGNGIYYWDLGGNGTIIEGTASTVAIGCQFPSSGIKIVRVSSGSQHAECLVNVLAVITPTPTPTPTVIPPITRVPTGPGDTTFVALLLAASLTLLYAGYTRSSAFYRHDAKKLGTEHDPLDFRN